jgi:hypothetical protein
MVGIIIHPSISKTSNTTGFGSISRIASELSNFHNPLVNITRAQSHSIDLTQNHHDPSKRQHKYLALWARQPVGQLPRDSNQTLLA